MALLQMNFRSRLLGGNTDVSILLPDQAGANREKFPVLWLLHGTGGDHSAWVRNSGIERYAAQQGILVVMPSVLSSNYADWDNFATGFHAGRYLPEELMPLIRRWFPASERRQDNWIAGNSMGGRGACQYACQYPERFAAACILSASPQDMRTHLDDRFFAKRNRNLVASLGGMDGYLASPYNLWDETGRLAKAGIELPELQFICGTRDPIAYEDFVRYRAYARQTGLNASFREVDGMGHEWDLWDSAIRRFVEQMGAACRLPDDQNCDNRTKEML